VACQVSGAHTSVKLNSGVQGMLLTVSDINIPQGSVETCLVVVVGSQLICSQLQISSSECAGERILKTGQKCGKDTDKSMVSVL